MTRDTIRTLMMLWSGLCAAFVLWPFVVNAAAPRGSGSTGGGACCSVIALGPGLGAWIVGMVVLGLSLLMFKEGPPSHPGLAPRIEVDDAPEPAPRSQDHEPVPLFTGKTDFVIVSLLGLGVVGFLAYQMYLGGLFGR